MSSRQRSRPVGGTMMVFPEVAVGVEWMGKVVAGGIAVVGGEGALRWNLRVLLLKGILVC